MREERFVQKIIGAYFAGSTLWVMGSDVVLHGACTMDTVKGVLYVFVSACVIYGVVMRKLRYFSYHDSSTSLPNADYFTDALGKRLPGNGFHALCVLQLDQVHSTSSFYDRSQQLEVVRELAARIRSRLSPADLLGVNAEHILQILLSSKRDKAEADRWLAALIAALKEPVMLKSKEEVYPQIHAGIACYPEDADDGELLVKLGYCAVEEAIRSQKDVSFCDERMRSTLLDSFHMESQLRRAIAADQFELYYQPKLCMKTGAVTGAEALIRWNHPERGNIRPDTFIPFAERYGLIVPIGEWVIGRVCADMREWRQSGLTPIPISINLSVRQLWHKDVVKVLADRMAETDTEASLITIEITESLTMDSGQALRILNSLKSLGVGISMDDFGTGYSSLGNLRHYPLDSLKIDRSFVDRMEDDHRNREIVSSMIHIAHALGLKVVAEGVETSEQQRLLQSMQCDEAQGYLFGKPMPGALFLQTII